MEISKIVSMVKTILDKPLHYQAGDDGSPIDVLYADQIGERLRREIEEKGIVVYDKEGVYV